MKHSKAQFKLTLGLDHLVFHLNEVFEFKLRTPEKIGQCTKMQKGVLIF